nr:ATP-binding cassette domain-containing protein [uncultured Caproiciproducens sp.]
MKITFQGITKQYKDKYALKEFITELQEGIYGLLGTNGAGKTTLINIFVGILKSDAGQVLIDGVDVRKLGVEFLARIGYLPQYPQFYKNFEVMEFLQYMCALKGISKPHGKKRAKELLEIVNLSEAHHKKIGALSGAVKTVGMMVLELSILLISSLFKTALLPFALSLAGAFGLIYWQGFFMGSEYLWAKVSNPFVLMVNREFFRKTEFVNLFGFPVPSYIMAMLAAAL